MIARYQLERFFGGLAAAQPAGGGVVVLCGVVLSLTMRPVYDRGRRALAQPDAARA